MSGIFGFTYQTDQPNLIEQTLAGLEYWNRIYGREAVDTARMGDSGIGCHVEHFSQDFPYGGPLLRSEHTVAVIDALLFNRDEMLPSLGLQAQAEISDEELLLLLIQRKGFEALADVNGDFAGAIYDIDTGEWTLFRDHLGVRPLYIYQDSGIFAFSTDIRGLAAIPGADMGINEDQFYAGARVLQSDMVFDPVSADSSKYVTSSGASSSSVSYGGVTIQFNGSNTEEIKRWITDFFSQNGMGYNMAIGG